MDESQKIINAINRKKSDNKQLFDENLLGNVHKKVTDKFLNVQERGRTGKEGVFSMDQRAENVIAADKNVRESVQSLVISLSELGDSDIAMKLIGQHILFLNDMFKEFEKSK